MLTIVVYLVTAAAQWKYFQKMGREGWEGIIPFYSVYVLFQELYGNGWKMLLLLVPVYNIYIIFKLFIDLAHAFNLSTGFGIGLTLLSPVFSCILGFGSAVYLDGTRAKTGQDVISRNLDNVAQSGQAFKPRRDPEALSKLKELSQLHEAGVLTDAEFDQKKTELLEKM